MSELISVRDFARRVGCSDVAVHKAVKTGKIVKGYVKNGDGPGKINPAIALKEWGKNYNPSYDRNPNIEGTLLPGQQESKAPNLPPSPHGKSLAEIKRLTAEIKLQESAIELKRKRGELVDKKQVYNALFAMGRELKNTVMNIPDRYIDAVLAAPTRNDAHTVLTNALIEALELLSEMQNREITT
jgi:hypothetical protein